MLIGFTYNEKLMETNRILFADIGNSSIDLLFHSSDGETVFKADWRKKKFPLRLFDSVSQAYASSVNAEALALLKQALNQIPLTLLSREEMKDYALKNGFFVDNIDILGSDLFCDFIARQKERGQIIIDLGTASKIMYISPERKLYGGMIFPSPLSFPKTLHADTDLLKNIDLKIAVPILSLNTDECISSGVTHGTAALISGTVKMIQKEYHDSTCDIFLTGGNRNLVAPLLEKYGLQNVILAENLVLEGLKKIYLK